MRLRVWIAGAILALAFPPAAMAADAGVFIDPGSPAGKEYALPIDSGRSEGTPTGTGARGADGHPLPPPPFGVGISRRPSRSSGEARGGGSAGAPSRDGSGARGGRSDRARGAGTRRGAGGSAASPGAGLPSKLLQAPDSAAVPGAMLPWLLLVLAGSICGGAVLARVTRNR